MKTNMLVHNTPVELYSCNGLPVIVKREDLCCPYPGPSFSKMRGALAHIQNRPEKIIGVLDTYHSKAGWAVSWACQQLGKKCVDFWPLYKADGIIEDEGVFPRQQQAEAYNLGAQLFALKAGRSAILYHQAKKMLAEYDPDNSYMMPNALKLPESITENAVEAKLTWDKGMLSASGTLIISISSGTVAAGVLKGIKDAGLWGRHDVILHMGYSRSEEATRRYIEKVSGVALGNRVEIIDQGYDYKAEARGVEAPFPCNSHYDLKAWKWLSENTERFKGQTVIFWNIGD